jgi:hypothetical protein
MTEADVIRAVRQYVEGLFPRSCPTCGRHFATLRDYILATKPIGPALSYDVELGDWDTQQPLGVIACANCPCGSTLAVTTEGMPVTKHLALFAWLRIELQRRGPNAELFLDYLRQRIRRQVLAESKD